MKTKLLSSLRIIMAVFVLMFASNFLPTTIAFADKPTDVVASSTTSPLSYTGQGLPVNQECDESNTPYLLFIFSYGGNYSPTGVTLNGVNVQSQSEMGNETHFTTDYVDPTTLIDEVNVTWTGDVGNAQLVISHGCAGETDETEITPTAPTATNPDCEVTSMTVTPPTQEGVVWSPLSSTVLQPGESVTYTASPAKDYTFPDGAQTEWTFENTFDTSTCERESTDGSITIKKNAIPDSSQGFNFTVTGAGLDDNFSLTDDSAPGLPSKTFSDLGAGTYTITEGSTDGWYLSSITCSKDGATVVKNKSDGKVTIKLDGSEQNVSCTFTNKKYKDVTLCHATGSLSNPYEEITINVAGAYNGHLGMDHQNGEDIIPPFTYKGHIYSQNYDETGQAILEAHCVVTPPEARTVTPLAPSFVAPTCESKGTYTIPDVEGVQYKVNGVVTPAGTYQANTGTSVTITAEATEGFVLKEGADASWNFEFNIQGGCVLGDNDVCPNIVGTQTTVPDGYTKNSLTGNCTKPVGHVLGASTELPNTGSSALLNVVSGLALILLALGARLAGRQQIKQN